MARKRFFLLAAALAVLAGLFGAALYSFRKRQRHRPPRVVKIRGVEKCYNYSLTPFLWCASPAEGKDAGLLVRDGDIVVVEIAGDADERTAFPYLERDGTSLSLKLEGSRLLLGEETVSLKLSEDEAGWRWLEKATREELARLRFLELGEDVQDSRVPVLKKLAGVNPNLELKLDGDAALRKVLPLFRPRRLMLLDVHSLGMEDFTAIVSSGENLEDLWFAPGEAVSLEFLTRLSCLRRLVMFDWDPGRTGPFPGGFRDLKALVLAGSTMKDLSPIAHFTRLSELHLFACESLTDIGALSGFSALETLGLGGCKELSDLSALKGLRGITWLSLPPGITQEEFAAVIGDHTGLRVLELLDCRNVNDLGPLKALRELEGLVLLSPLATFEPLYEMKGLRLLVLPEDVFTESPDEARKLEEALPECTVVAGGLCLGSGWILMLFPAVALAWLLSRGRRARAPGMRPGDA